MLYERLADAHSRKGCTKLQNLTTLEWTRYYGIRCGWNLLHGFPGEHGEDYADQLATLRNITHFHPRSATYG